MWIHIRVSTGRAGRVWGLMYSLMQLSRVCSISDNHPNKWLDWVGSGHRIIGRLDGIRCRWWGHGGNGGDLARSNELSLDLTRLH